MKELFKDKIILIIGGAGSVGCALTRETLKYNPHSIRIFDISENELFKMKSNFIKEERIRYLIGDVRDVNRLELAMEDIDICIQLAGMKHVYTCEYNPFEAIKTNIDGLQNVINVARNKNIEKLVFASTDKAVLPTSVMGMTKLLGEKLISLANYYRGDKRTVFVSVRFGNVIGSNGSAVPLFKKQIIEGGPLTITDRAMTRFVITMDEAVRLIYSAVKFAKGGETFIWKMRTLKVTDLAKVMIKNFGSGKKIKIEVIGKCEGEKIHEEILTKEEAIRGVEFDNLYIVFSVIDHLHVDRKHKEARPIKDPIIASNIGPHMSLKDIEKLLEYSEAKRC